MKENAVNYWKNRGYIFKVCSGLRCMILKKLIHSDSQPMMSHFDSHEHRAVRKARRGL